MQQGRWIAGGVAAVVAVLGLTFVAAGPAFSLAPEVETSSVHVRKNVKDLTPEEKKEYVDAVLKLKSTPDPNDPTHSWYDGFVLWHKNAFKCLSLIHI